MNEFAGKIVLITGGAKGVGKAIATLFGRKGARVILNYFHSHDQAKATRQELEAEGIRVYLIRASVARADQVDRMFTEIEEQFGGLDILVNNAADGALVGLDEITEEQLNRAFNTNVKGALWCARKAVPLMKKRGGGAIVNVSSLGAQFPLENYAVVGPTKAALESLTKYLALEYAQFSIRVNTASAGLLDTEVIRHFPDYEKMTEEWRQATPMGRIGHAEDLANVVVFLASEQSRWITGQTIVADGGMSVSGLPCHNRRSEEEGTIDPDKTGVESPGPGFLKQKKAEQRAEDEIVIVGMGLALPGAKTPDEFWNVLMEGPDLVSETPAERWNADYFVSSDPAIPDKGYCPYGFYITEPDLHDKQADYTVGWLRHAVTEALAMTASKPEDRFSWLVGYTADGSQYLEEACVVQEYQRLFSAAAERLALPDTEKEKVIKGVRECLTEHYEGGKKPAAYYLPHKAAGAAIHGILPAGTRMRVIDTACSSSLYAVDAGIKELRGGECDIAVCGGAMALGPLNSVLFSRLGGLSRSGRPLPLSADADGVLFADGAAVIILKRRTKAEADGDTILGVISGTGCSSDGKGKAVAAPNSTGQILALRRAWENNPDQAKRVRWILTHATGTPRGDAVELEALAAQADRTGLVYLTSNKGLIGHTGWAAGIVSIIQVILSLRHAVILPQHGSENSDWNPAIQKSRFDIPAVPVSWQAEQGQPRVTGVSGFGFGGTNAHVLISEHSAGPRKAACAKTDRDRIVIIAWSARVPGLDTMPAITAWLQGRGEAPGTTFGKTYVLSADAGPRIPPKTLRTLDRSQLMAVECVHEIRTTLGLVFDRLSETTGVFIGHMGKTGHAIHYGTRCYREAVFTALEQDKHLAGSGWLEQLKEIVTAEIEQSVPASNEDSFSGMMPNIIAARIANWFDLHGPTMTIDGGYSSGLSALEAAQQYLQAGDITMALCGGVNGSSLPAMTEILRESGCTGAVAGEGIFMVALMRETDARRYGISVLGVIESCGAGLPETGTAGTVVSCGVPRKGGPGINYLGGEGALGLLKALHAGKETVMIACAGDTAEWNRHIQLSVPAARKGKEAVSGKMEQENESENYDQGMQLLTQRHEVQLVALPEEYAGHAIPFVQKSSIILTNDTRLISAIGELPEEIVVISTTAIREENRSWQYLPEITPAAVKNVLDRNGRSNTHVRILVNLEQTQAAEEAIYGEAPELTKLHDLLFLVARAMHPAMIRPGSSCLGLFTGALRQGIPHPLSGLFAGLINGIAREVDADCQCVALFTAAHDVSEALKEMERVVRLRKIWPAVFRENGEFKTLIPIEQAVEPTENNQAWLGRESVVVATGGARGITAEIMKELARRFRPKVYLIGSNPIYNYPAEIFEGSNEAFTAGKAEYIREQAKENPGKAVREIVEEFNRMWNARQAKRAIEEMKRQSGEERVRYYACDVRDGAAIAAIMKEITAREGKIDLLINGAGTDRSQSLPMKSFDDFRTVRDIKYKAYLNLKTALRGNLPELWCNFGSIVSTLPVMPGQVDYLAGNSFLNTAALWVDAEKAGKEFTIGWPVWHEAGMVIAPYKTSVVQVIRDTGFFTEIATAEGIHHFMNEVLSSSPAPVTIYTGLTEKEHVRNLFSGTAGIRRILFPRDNINQKNYNGTARGFYLDRVVQHTEDQTVFERTFTLQRDGYLREHLVQGYATVPGTFVPEIAAEAAHYLFPDMMVCAFEDIQFKHYLRVYGEDKPTLARIEARITDHSRDAASVAVRICTDVVSPKGIVLKKDREHFSLTVQLIRKIPQAPACDQYDSVCTRFIPDPYHAEQSPVYLSGIFVSTADTGLTKQGGCARYTAPITPEQRQFAEFIIPVFLLDGLARVMVLSDSEYQPVAVPHRIKRIEVFTKANDARLAEQKKEIRLFANSMDALGTIEKEKGMEGIAVDDSQRCIMRITGLSGTITGYIHTETGEMLTPRQRREPGEKHTQNKNGGSSLALLARKYEASVRGTSAAGKAQTFEEHIHRLNAPLEEARREGLYFYEQEIEGYHGARVDVEGRSMLMMASYSYLDLLGHPAITKAVEEALHRYGAGTHGARLLAGTTSLHHELERIIAAFKHADDAIVYSSGYVTNVATISTLVGEGDWVICDTLNHSSIVDGARFSAARFVQFGHNNMQALTQRLKHCQGGRKLVVVDAVFSMDGDIANLPELIRVCREHGALLMVDEAHSTGVLGEKGHGIFEHFGIEPDPGVLQMGTLSKAIASVGGYVAGSKEMIFALKNQARGFVFSAALPPPQAAAAKAAFELLAHEPERVARLRHNALLLREGLAVLGFNILNSCTPIVPVVCGTIVKTIQMTRACKQAGIFVLPVMFPAVPLESPRLRVTVTAAHSEEDIQFALTVFEQAGRESGVLSAQSQTIPFPDVQNGKTRQV